MILGKPYLGSTFSPYLNTKTRESRKRFSSRSESSTMSDHSTEQQDAHVLDNVTQDLFQQAADATISVEQVKGPDQEPSLLAVALRTLPKVVGVRQDLTDIQITRVGLYDKFIENGSSSA
ncbi:hypothetical protein BG015_002231 [Linnemannia schmuckeri]|uniref:Uncharacterized protein n=1 Tax=Linnemannia schmuckeri TaxID=64567 RepID=A0A9P5RNU1_9FUNG|nr:hypothetical protein BG015_002231 [Linnemannia schmuckeri]